MAQGSSGKKVANGLVALSSAAVMAVYTAGYMRTSAAASRLDAQTSERRPPPPGSLASPAPAPLTTVHADPVPERAPIDESAKPLPSQLAAKVEVPPTAAPIVETTATPTPTAAPVPEAKVIDPKPEPVAVAPAPPPAPPPPPPAPAKPVWKDGTYTGWGTSRHGDIEAIVVIENGKILSAKIKQCLTRYSCDIIDKLPPQVAQRQSPETDYISGATQSTNAFYYGVVEALGKAK